MQASQRHNVTLSGGSNVLNFLLSGSYYDKDGIMKINPDKYNNYTFRSKINAQLTPWLKLSNNTQYYNSRYKYQGREGGGNDNFVYITVHAMPAYAPMNPDGTPTYNTIKNNYSIGDGIFALLLQGQSGGANQTHEIITTNSATIDITDDLKLNADHSYTVLFTDNYYRSTVTKYSIEPGKMQEVPNYNTDLLKQTRVLQPMNVSNVYLNYNK